MSEQQPSVAELAAHVGVSAQTLRELKEKLHLSKRPTFEELRLAYIKYLRDLATGKGYQPDGEGSLSKLKVEFEKARVLKLQMANARFKGELLDSKEVESQWNTTLMALRTKLLSIPNSLSPTLSACKDFAEVKAVLELAMNDTLQDMADFNLDDYSKEAPEQEEQDEQEKKPAKKTRK